jgi:hypothetical protein
MSAQRKLSSRNAKSCDNAVAEVTYVDGFDDPSANVILIGKGKKALRVHDYFLKAAR